VPTTGFPFAAGICDLRLGDFPPLLYPDDFRLRHQVGEQSA